MAGHDAAHITNVALGAQIREARIHHGVSLRALARDIYVSPATLSQIENGRTTLSAIRLQIISHALKMTSADLLVGNLHNQPSYPDHRTRHSQHSPELASEYHNVSAPASATQSTTITSWRVYDALNFDPMLSAALIEMMEVGYHGASVRNIAARCGFSVSGLYHHYPSKQEMLMSIIVQTMMEILWRARAAQREGDSPVNRFSYLIENLVLFHVYRQDISFVAANELRNLTTPNRQTVEILRSNHKQLINEEVDSAVRLGCFRKNRPHAATRAAIAMCMDIATWWRPDDELTPEQIAKQYVEFACDLMLNPQPGKDTDTSLRS